MGNEVIVSPISDGDPMEFQVNVGSREYFVTVAKEWYKNLTHEKITADSLVQKSFEFLLDREPPNAILREFDIQEISHYFPEYEAEILKKILKHERVREGWLRHRKTSPISSIYFKIYAKKSGLSCLQL